MLRYVEHIKDHRCAKKALTGGKGIKKRWGWPKKSWLEADKKTLKDRNEKRARKSLESSDMEKTCEESKSYGSRKILDSNIFFWVTGAYNITFTWVSDRGNNTKNEFSMNIKVLFLLTSTMYFNN